MNNRLEDLLGRQSKIERQMTNISRSLANLNTANNEANNVNSMIENTSQLAENVSAKVRRLDEARVSIPHTKFNKTKFFFKYNFNYDFVETCIRMPTACARFNRFASVFTRRYSCH